MRSLAPLVLALSLVSFGIPAAVHSQCTAPESAGLAAAATAIAEATAWPLPVPRNARIDSLEDLRGVLLLAGSVYQIERLVWQITPTGNLDVLEFEGYSREGTRVQVAKQENGRRVESLADLTGFNIGNPHGKGRLFAVDAIGLRTDRHGFLTISTFQGLDQRNQKAVAVVAVENPRCGLRIKTSCDGSACNGGACGAAPGCPCNGTSGGCSGYSESVCSGDCPDGMVCNGSVADCKCITKPKVEQAPSEQPLGGSN
jgi:hypothetical protein